MKHTKGEWKVVNSESKPAFNVIGTVLGGKYKIARCPYVQIEDEELQRREIQEALANAKLIAAAPELLEALQKASKELYCLMYHCVDMGFINLDDETDGLKDHNEAIEMARNAIAKATT